MNIFKIKTAKEFSELQADRDNLLKRLQESENVITNLQNMSKDVMEAKAENEKALETTKAEYAKSLESLQADHDKQIAELKAANDTLKAEHEKAVTELKAQYSQQVEASKAVVESEKQSAEAKAQKIVANIGVPEAELPKKTITEATPQEIVEAWKSKNGKEKNDFYAKHRQVILKELKLIK